MCFTHTHTHTHTGRGAAQEIPGNYLYVMIAKMTLKIELYVQHYNRTNESGTTSSEARTFCPVNECGEPHLTEHSLSVYEVCRLYRSIFFTSNRYLCSVLSSGRWKNILEANTGLRILSPRRQNNFKNTWRRLWACWTKYKTIKRLGEILNMVPFILCLWYRMKLMVSFISCKFYVAPVWSLCTTERFLPGSQ